MAYSLFINSFESQYIGIDDASGYLEFARTVFPVDSETPQTKCYKQGHYNRCHYCNECQRIQLC